jgi:hypothetical protein
MNTLRISQINLALVIRIIFVQLVRDHEKLVLLFLARDGKRKCHEWIEGYGDLLALAAHQSRFILTVEEVDDDTLISDQVLDPGFFASELICNVVCLCKFNIGLLRLTEKVLTQKVKDGIDALLRVVLSISFELLSVVTEYLFEHGWSHNRLITVPHLIKKLSVGLNKSSFCSKWIVLIQVSLEALI